MFSRTPRHAATASEAGPSFTEAARRGLGTAREEAQRLGRGQVDTEHVLLALARDADGGAGRLLGALLAPAGADLAALRGRAEAAAAAARRTGPDLGGGDALPYTRGAKRALELALHEAADLGTGRLGTEHLLLGLLAEGRGRAAQVLAEHGVALEAARAALRNGAVQHGATPAAADVSAFRVVIDDASDRSIYEQVVAQVQEAVATGHLCSGERLPTVRQLADALGVAPGTVARSYAELERLGVVVTEGTRGTRVAPRPRPLPAADRPAALAGLLRPVAVAAFHLGASAVELRDALTAAMAGIFEAPRGPDAPDGAPAA